MAEAQHTVTINAPAAAVYKQWAELESFPNFLDSVRAVTSTTASASHWTLSIGRFTRQFDAEITDSVPHKLLAWRTTGGDVAFTGHAEFDSVDDGHTRVTLAITWQPKTTAERAAAALGTDDRTIRSALRAFKDFIETNPRQSIGAHAASADADTDGTTGSSVQHAPTTREPRHLRA